MSCAATDTTDTDHLDPSPIADRGDRPGSFDSLGLPRTVLAGVRNLGFTSPTPIQASAIPVLLSGRDVTGVAQTGTGKTAAFGLPLLATIDPSLRQVQALVLTPTRELALQVSGALRDFANALPGVRVATVYGGSPYGPQLAALRGGSQIVVGTPGRLIDHLQRGSLRLDDLRIAVLDEADEMLAMGFVDDIDQILGAAPAQRQTALFSATMPRSIQRVAAAHLRAPVDVGVTASATPVPAIDQFCAVVPFRLKTEALIRILSTTTADAAVVFVRTRSACEQVSGALVEAGMRAAPLSGDISQADRERTVAALRNGGLDVLVATDVAARGLDVERIGLVVNFDAPADPEIYIHRIGRTGRAGQRGEAITFFTPQEKGKLRAVERTVGRPLPVATIPTVTQVTTHRARLAVAAAVERAAAGRLEPFTAAIGEAARHSGLSESMIAAALVATAIDDDGSALIEHTQLADVAPHDTRPRQREDRRDRRTPRQRRTGDRSGRRTGPIRVRGGEQRPVGTEGRGGQHARTRDDGGAPRSGSGGKRRWTAAEKRAHAARKARSGRQR